MKRSSFTALLALTIAACQQPLDDSNIAIDEVNNLATAGDIESLPPSEESGAPVDFDSGSDAGDLVNQVDADNPATPPGGAAIPAQYRGRWGLVAADCTSTRGDAKGLITVGDTSIRFYESTASLQEQRPAIATSFSGVFVFNGEGQTWERVMTFTRTGDTLKRADSEGSYTYTRCA